MPNILLAAVVRIPFVHKLSFRTVGTPANIPSGFSITGALSSVRVMNACMLSSHESIRFLHDSNNSADENFFSLIPFVIQIEYE